MSHVTQDMINEWGKEAATNLIEHNIPLNQSLTKIAEDYALNSNQVARTVEAANVATHTRINVNNKYPEFEVAKVSAIIGDEKTAELQDVDDYTLSPKDFDLTMTKEATYSEVEERELSPFVANRVKAALEGASRLYDEKIAELAQNFYDKAEEVKFLVKQAILDPDQTDYSLSLFKEAALATSFPNEQVVVNALINDIYEESKSYGSALYKKATAEPEENMFGLLNTEHPVLNKLAEYKQAFNLYIKGVNRKAEAMNKIAEEICMTYGITEKQAGLLSNTAKIGIPLALGGAVIAGAHKAGQNSALRKISPMRYDKLPENYKR